MKSQKIKSMKNKEKISMLTAYDFPIAKLMDEIVDIILVGDSLGMVVLGYEDTTKVTIQDMLRATEAVSRGAKKALIVGDMPLGTYEAKEDSLKNAKLFLEAGADCVKVENKPEIVKHLCENNIEVMGHIGLTPQTITKPKVQGKTDEDANKIFNQAKDIEAAGAFSIVLECIPIDLAKKISQEIKIPTIGIGAGIHCDGQVLVTYDLLGIFTEFKPKFVKKYKDLGEEMKQAFKKYTEEVKEGKFPDDDHSFH